MDRIDQIYHGDCLDLLARWNLPPADLIFADPPFNIGYSYDHYRDRRRAEDYIEWTRRWMAACCDVLAPHGSFYIAIGDEYAAHVRLLGDSLGLTLRNWIIWHYSFGQNARTQFCRAHTHIFYFVRDPRNFVFNDRAVRFPSARHTEYSDPRGHPLGRVPDDVWDEFPRVCGTFREREGWHGCQMPEALLMRIIRASSNPGDLVLDPFAGSGTTLVAAARLGRHYVGIELSAEYVAAIRRRLHNTLREATPSGRSNGARRRPSPTADASSWPALHRQTLAILYRETNTRLDNLLPNEVAMRCFTDCLNARLGSAYTPAEVAEALQALNRAGELPRLRNDRPYTMRRRARRSTRAAGQPGALSG